METAPESATPLDFKSPWNSAELYPEPPAHLSSEWGYVRNIDTFASTLEGLRSEIAWDRSKSIKLVWAPHSTRIIPPEEVAELQGDVRHRDILHARGQLRQYLFIGAIWTALALTNATSNSARADRPFISYFILPLVLGIIPAMQIGWSLYRMRTREFSREDALNAGQQVRYQEWLRRSRAPVTWSLIIALLTVGLVQIYTSFQHLFEGTLSPGTQSTWSAIDAAGLVKSAVWDGEVWRLFTGSMLHGTIWHFVFNVLALYVFGKIVEVLVGGAYLPIVFFFSALAGAILSLLLVPVTSVGSSGGIMGIVGFLAVLGYYNRASLPPDFFKSILHTIAFVALFGLVAFVIVDNAAHAGGALCGALLGYLLLPHRPTALPQKPGQAVKVLSVLCTLGIVASVLGSMVAMFTWR